LLRFKLGFFVGLVVAFFLVALFLGGVGLVREKHSEFSPRFVVVIVYVDVLFGGEPFQFRDSLFVATVGGLAQRFVVRRFFVAFLFVAFVTVVTVVTVVAGIVGIVVSFFLFVGLFVGLFVFFF